MDLRQINISNKIENFIKNKTKKFDTESAKVYHALMQTKFTLSFDELKSLDVREIKKYKRYIIEKKKSVLGTKLETDYKIELKMANKLLQFKNGTITEKQLLEDDEAKSSNNIEISDEMRELIDSELKDDKYSM